MYARSAGDYAHGSRGDHYGRGGLFSFLGGAIKSIAKVALPFVGGPIGAIGGMILGTHPNTNPSQQVMYSQPHTMPGLTRGRRMPRQPRMRRARRQRVR